MFPLQWVVSLFSSKTDQNDSNDVPKDSADDKFNGNSREAIQIDSDVVDKENYSLGIKIEDINKNLTLEVLKLLELDLTDYEKVSLVFLLYDITDHALQVLKIEFANNISERHVVSEWAKAEKENWRFKLLEALAIIQNYEVIEKMGFSKNDVQLYFQIYSTGSKYIDSIKKHLYLISENLSLSEAKNLISLFQEEMIKQGKDFKDLWGVTMNNYIEICFLHMLSYRIIINEDEHIDMHNLKKIFKKMDKLDTADKLSQIEREVAQQRINNSPYLKNKNEENLMEDVPQPQKPGSLEDDGVSSKYTIIDKNNLGLCVILNEEKFEKHHTPKLEDRSGSQNDVDELRKTFKINLKMDFYELKNLHSYKIIEIIKYLINEKFDAKSIQCCIYGTDCKPVQIKDLEDGIADCTVLKNKPKILIIQACQKEINKTAFHAIVTDGPSEKSDFITCMATLEGLEALRSIYLGTFYIQNLCREINKNKDKKHLLDIITIVHRKIEEQTKLSPYVMIPNFSSTLTKELYFCI